MALSARYTAGMYHAWLVLLEWCEDNASAVQALSAAVTASATVVLVAVTAWYARLTKKLADSTVEQLRLAKSLEDARIKRARESLHVLVARFRVTLGTINQAEPEYGQLRGLATPSESDLAKLEAYGELLELGHLVSPALVPLRQLLAMRARVAAISQTTGWMPDERDKREYQARLTNIAEALRELEQAAIG